MIVRLCKTALATTTAVFFALVAFGNLTDYATNFAFVQHVLAMDTIFPGSKLTWRAITDKRVAALAYWLIIGWEIVTAAILVVATMRLASTCRDRQLFSQAKPVAILGLTFGLLLYGLGIIVIGGEYFAMWQSKTWNGLDSAARYMLLNGIVLLALLVPEE
jgi:predicted small integral membrane protein